MEKVDYIPISLIERIYSERDGIVKRSNVNGLGTMVVIKLKNGETWSSSRDIMFSKHAGGIEGDFERIN